MKRKKHVLIVIDSYHREQIGAVRLANALRRHGIATTLCDRRHFREAFERTSPEAVILPKLHKIPGAEDLDLTQTRVFLLFAESFTGSEAGIRAYFETTVSAPLLSKVTGIFCWGEIDSREIGRLIGNSPIPVHVTGHPSTESWYHRPMRGRERVVEGRDTKRIGITTSLRALTHSQRPKTTVETIVSLENSGRSGFYDPPNHCESWVAYEASFIRILHNLATLNPSIELRIRVHPNESLKEYRALTRFHRNVTISKGGSFADWCSDVDSVLSAYSTSMLDAAIFGKPVYSLTGLIPKYIIERIPPAISDLASFKLFPELRSFDLSEISADKYQYDEKRVAEFLRATFSFPATDLPSEQIARIIAREIEQPVEPTLRTGLRRGGRLRRLMYSDLLYSLYLDMRAFGRKEVYFKPHRLLRNYSIRKQAQR